jgi:hypothetical protein
MSRLARVLAGCLAVVLLIPAGAAAYSSLIPIDVSGKHRAAQGGVSGPVFAGDSIVWGRGAVGGYELIVEGGGGRKVHKLRIPGARHLYSPSYGVDISASSERIGLSFNLGTCDNYEDCKYGFERTVFHGAFAGTSAHPFGRVAHCTRYDPRYDDEGTAPPVAVSGNVVAYDDCQTVHIRDYSSGEQRELPGGVRMALAGDFVAVDRDPDQGVVVTNWRTGEDLYAVRTDAFGLQDDGKLVFVTDERQTAWRSVADPSQHVVTSRDTGGRIASDRIAYVAADSDGFGYSIEERDLDGGLVARARDDAVYTGMDFDGSRMTWITKPCETAGIVVWDGVGRPPGLPGRCPTPRVVRGSARLDGRRHLLLDLKCPRTPWLGCPGVMTALNPVRRRRDLRGYNDYTLDPGESRTVRVYKSHAFCVDARGRLRTILLLWPAARAGARHPRGQLRRTIRVRGALPDTPACG